MATETTEQIVREAPEIEAYKLGLLQSAKALPAPVLPGYQVAGMSPEQISAIQAGMGGIGAYQPYLQAGQQNLGAGAATTAEAADILRGADTRGQFAAAQQSYNLAAQPAAAMGNLANVAGSGMGLLGQGAAGLTQAQNLSLQAGQQPGFTTAQQAAQQAQTIAGQAGPSNFSASGQLLGLGLTQAQQASEMAARASQQQGFQQGIGSLAQGAQQGMQAAGSLGAAPTAQGAQTGYTPNLQAFQMGPAQQVQAQSFGQQGTAESMMSPYMDAVVKAQQREAIRQSDIMGTQRAAQAVKAGAFGGSRQAIESAEAQRNLSTQLGDIQAGGLQSAYQQATNQFNTEQQARLTAQQANQQAGLTVGQQNLASQQATQQLGTQAGLQTNLANLSNEQQAALANQAMQGQYGLQGAQLGMQAAGLTQNVGQAQIGAASQQGQLGMQAAAQQFQNAGYDAATAMQMAQLQQTQQQQQLAQSQSLQGIGALQGQLAGQEGQLGLQAAGQFGQLAGQQAGLAGQYANIAGQQAGILGQQSQLQQQIGQGIGGLATQQFGVGQQMSQGLGALGGQLGNLGVQQAALGQTAQGLGQQDVNFQYNLGSQLQRQTQAELDAQRATSMQTALQPTQQLAFLSDIYKGAPSTQMAATTQNQAAPSPFQQVAGLATGALATAGAAKTAGLF